VEAAARLGARVRRGHDRVPGARVGDRAHHLAAAAQQDQLDPVVEGPAMHGGVRCVDAVAQRVRDQL
jgi:hypothetical protein